MNNVLCVAEKVFSYANLQPSISKAVAQILSRGRYDTVLICTTLMIAKYKEQVYQELCISAIVSVSTYNHDHDGSRGTFDGN